MDVELESAILFSYCKQTMNTYNNNVSDFPAADYVVVSWPNHQSLIINVIQQHFEEEDHFDCTLWADGLTIDCHRIVLSACSPFLREILKEHPSDRPIITIEGLAKAELRAIVEFIYTGETSVSNDILGTFLETCKFLEITGLKDYTLVKSDAIIEEDPLSSFHIENNVTDFYPEVELGEEFISLSKDVFELDEPQYDVTPSTDSETLVKAGNGSIIIKLEEGYANIQTQENLEYVEEEQKTEGTNPKKKTVDSAPDKRYECTKCGKKYSHRRTLLHHLHWICNQPATYACNLCSYTGKRRFQLVSHLKHAHSRTNNSRSLLKYTNPSPQTKLNENCALDTELDLTAISNPLLS